MCLYIFIIAKDRKRSIFIEALSHVRNFLKHEKLLSHSYDVTGKVNPIFDSLNTFGNLVSSHSFIGVAKVAGR